MGQLSYNQPYTYHQKPHEQCVAVQHGLQRWVANSSLTGHIEVAITQDLHVSSILLRLPVQQETLHLRQQTLVVLEEAHMSVESQDA